MENEAIELVKEIKGIYGGDLKIYNNGKVIFYEYPHKSPVTFQSYESFEKSRSNWGQCLDDY